MTKPNFKIAVALVALLATFLTCVFLKHSADEYERYRMQDSLRRDSIEKDFQKKMLKETLERMERSADRIH